jgi:capsular polysaccharide biosynthesis protein
VVVLAVVVAAAAAWGVGEALTRDYSAEAVLVVRVGGPLAAQPDASTKLASTYATLLPLDAAVQHATERALPTAESTSFTASSDANTAVLRIEYSAPTAERAKHGAGVIASVIATPTPPSRSILPRTLEVVRLPTTATRSGGTPAQIAIVGAALGLLLGLVLVAFWRARDARIDDVRELRTRLDCPCFEVNRRTGAGARTLIETLATSPHRTAVVLPCRPRDERAATVLRSAIGDVLGGERALRAAAPGSADAGELVAAAADATILVVTPGVRVADLDEALDILGRYGAIPSYAVLGGRRGSDEAATVVVPDAPTAAPTRSTG